MIGCLALAMVAQAAKFSGLVRFEAEKVLLDFDAFHIVSRMVWLGRLDDAYELAKMLPIQRALSGVAGSLPWTYPPTFDLVIAPLALLPLWLSYLLFTGTTLGAYLLVLRRLAGDAYGAVLIAFFPALVVGAVCGQNGFLTATLLGLACIGLMRREAAAGVPLGLMAIKPHLAICLAVYTLATRRWTTIVCAAAVVALLCGASTLAFGPSIWTAFLRGAGEAGEFLRAGAYPMHRMVSAYAFLLTAGLPAKAAMAGQLVVSALIFAAIWTAIRSGMSPQQILALCAMASPLVTPYAYDYDLPACSIGVALVLADLVALTTVRERLVLVALSWAACGWGLTQQILTESRYGPEGAPDNVLAGAGLVMLVLFALVWRTLHRDRRPAPAAATRPAVTA